jgi:hypothetical protein
VVKAPARRCGGSYVARYSAWCRRCWRTGIVTGAVLSVPVGGAVRIVRDEYGVRTFTLLASGPYAMARATP